MERIRSSPLRLVDLKPEKPKELGPYEAIGLRLSLEGSFAELDDFLGWIESEKRFLRFDSIRLTPDIRQAGRLSAQFTLMTLVEKTAPAPKAKDKAGKKA